MNPLLQTGAFVITFRRGTSFEAGTVQGRIEHVASGWSASFGSRDELLALLERGFDENQATVPSGTPIIHSCQEE